MHRSAIWTHAPPPTHSHALKPLHKFIEAMEMVVVVVGLGVGLEQLEVGWLSLSLL